MCRSQSEGGQRCYAHVSKQLAGLRSSLDTASSADRYDLEQKVYETQIELASTPTGADEIRETLDALPASSFERPALEAALQRGAELRERNEATRQALAEAAQAQAIARETRAAETITSDGQYTTVKGGKYTGWRPAAEIAKDIRQDLKQAQREGALPTSINGRPVTFAVRKESFAGGQAINVYVKGLTDAEMFADDFDDWGNARSSEQSLDLQRQVQAYANAYNRTESDPYTDYHNNVYFCHVQVEDEEHAAFEEWETKKHKPLAREYKVAVAAGNDTYALSLRTRMREERGAYQARRAAITDRRRARFLDWQRRTGRAVAA